MKYTAETAYKDVFTDSFSNCKWARKYIEEHPDGHFELFEDDHCFVLGGLSRSVYEEYEFTLPKGCTLFLYTDGATEATNAKEELFGEERVEETLNKFTDASVKELLEGVHAEINTFVGTAPQYDDLTMLGIKLL